MNNVIILGEVIEKSTMHFNYFDKLKAYFFIRVMENSNIFEIVVSEKYIDIKIMNSLYGNIVVGNKLCICGSIIKEKDMYIIVCDDVI